MTNLAWLSDFRPPADAVEALERGLEYARFEEHWTQSALFRPGPNAQYDGHGVFIAAEDNAAVCTNVRACAMGILVIACLDGPAVRQFFTHEGFHETQELRKNPVAMEATIHLARGFGAKFHTEDLEDHKDEFHYALSNVEDRNDWEETQHLDIVQGFEKSVEIAKQAQETAT